MALIRTKARGPVGALALLAALALSTSCSDDDGPRADAGRDAGGEMRSDLKPAGDGAADAVTEAGADGATDTLAPDLLSPDAGMAGGRFELKTATRTLRLTLVERGLLRVHYLRPSGTPQPDRGWTHTLGALPTATLPAHDLGDRFRIETPLFEVLVRKADATVTVNDRSRAPQLPLLAERAPSTAPTTYTRRVELALPTDARIYGLGEKVGPLDKRGMALTMWNSDPLASGSFETTTDPLYQSVPFFIAHRPSDRSSVGVYLDSTFESHFDLGKTKADTLSFETKGGELAYFVLHGPDLRGVVRRFSRLTGRAPLPPLWSLGYHQCKWSYAPESELRKVAAELRKRKIPADGLWLDIDYMDGFRSFTWSPTAFPDPTKLLADMEADGFKTTVIIDPGIKHDPGGSYAAYDTGASGGHFIEDAAGQTFIGQVWPGDAVFPDFTRAATRSWWGQQVKGLVDVGVRGIWIDMNEPTTWKPKTGFPIDSRADGEGTPTDHRETHNVYALLMAKATREGLAKAAPDRRPFVLTRAGFAGIQRYAAVWTGDQESTWGHLAMSPAMLANMGLSGVVFAGTDVGGYSGNPGAELYARWIQLGSLSTFFRTHTQTGMPPQEPWAFGAQVEQISRAAIERRYRRLPYLYSLMAAARETGDPPLRPLIYDYSGDATAATVSDQLLLGPFLLAAPVVTKGQTLRRVYLPQGTWVDLDNDRGFAGGATIDIAAPLEKLPRFARENAILPAWDVTQYVGEKIHDRLYLDLYPVAGGAAGELALYADDGASFAHQSGSYQRVATRLETDASGATLTLAPAEGSYSSSERRLWLVFHGVKAAPSGATHDGKALTKLASLAELPQKDGWFYDAKDRIGHISLAFPRQGATLKLSYDASKPLATSVALQVSVTLPAGTPAGDIYLATSKHDWEADGVKLQRSGSAASATLTLQAGETLRYKVTRGSWATVEKASGCAERQNREVLVVDGGAGQQSLALVVDGWADACP